MSRLPSKEGVEKLRAVISDFRFLAKRTDELRKAVKELPKVEEEAGQKQREALKLLEEMDLAEKGNMGWEGRMMWFLNELDKQAGVDPS